MNNVTLRHSRDVIYVGTFATIYHDALRPNMTTMASDPVLRQSVLDDENVNRTCLICGEIT